jgi:hypothetical protein
MGVRHALLSQNGFAVFLRELLLIG